MSSNISFTELGLDKWLLKNITFLRYKTPTKIQEKCIPLIFKEENVVGIANTGSGKTASFCLPILNNLALDPYGIYALILEPTRELALQVYEKLKVFATSFNLRTSLIIGGVDMTEQLSSLDKIPHIIVATPGRLAYMIKMGNEHFKYLDNLKFLVLDEFDQLLNETIQPDLDYIIENLPKERQNLFFSATFERMKFNEEFFGKICDGKLPKIVDLTNENENSLNNNEVKDSNNDLNNLNEEVQNYSQTVEQLIQNYLLVPNQTKEYFLLYLLQNNFRNKYIIIFVATCKKCHFISSLLKLFDLKVSFIHSKVNQKQRFDAINKFRANINNILVATDLAARGLDIPEVDLVINFDLPRKPADYVHRVGRTARAGQEGTAVSIISQYDIQLLLTIEEFIKKKLNEMKVDEDKVMENLGLYSKGVKLVQTQMYESGILDKMNEKQKKNWEKSKMKKEKKKEEGI